LRENYGQVIVVHRLDKEPNSVIFFARNLEANRKLNLQFENRLVTITYHAICTGYPQWQRFTANFPLKVNGDRRHRSIIDHQKGKPATSEFKIHSSRGKVHLTEIHPNNGYTHSVRAHAPAVAIPLLSDPLYHHPLSLKVSRYEWRLFHGSLCMLTSLNLPTPPLRNYSAFTLTILWTLPVHVNGPHCSKKQEPDGSCFFAV